MGSDGKRMEVIEVEKVGLEKAHAWRVVLALFCQQGQWQPGHVVAAVSASRGPARQQR
jgi:hypothetical protein